MDKENIESCAKRISKALSIRGLKQAELCNLTGIPKSAMSQYIKGSFEPKQDRVYLLARALKVNEAWLMGYDVPMEKETATYDGNGLGDSKKKLLDFAMSCTEEQAERVLKMMLMVESILGKK